jgi:hypothetical protein
MGFLDKVKAQAEQTLKQGQEKIDEVQAKKKADGLLRDLGAWYYASHTGRDDGKGEGELARLIAELKAHEAEHGPLDRRDDDQDDPTGAEAATVASTDSAAPSTPPTDATPPGYAPPAAPPTTEMPPPPLPPAGAPPMPAAPLVPPPSSAPGGLAGGGPALDGP